jgi:hypothetical protein
MRGHFEMCRMETNKKRKCNKSSIPLSLYAQPRVVGAHPITAESFLSKFGAPAKPCRIQ